MAAPASATYFTWSFKDAKGNRSRTTLLLGGASESALITTALGMTANFQAASNAHVTIVFPKDVFDNQYGASAVYEDVEDKASLTFQNSSGRLNRYQIPAPKAACFLADGETVDVTGAANALILAIETNAFSNIGDTSPLAFVGGIRLRRRLHRRFNIWTLSPPLTGPGE